MTGLYCAYCEKYLPKGREIEIPDPDYIGGPDYAIYVCKECNQEIINNQLENQTNDDKVLNHQGCGGLNWLHFGIDQSSNK